MSWIHSTCVPPNNSPAWRVTQAPDRQGQSYDRNSDSVAPLQYTIQSTFLFAGVIHASQPPVPLSLAKICTIRDINSPQLLHPRPMTVLFTGSYTNSLKLSHCPATPVLFGLACWYSTSLDAIFPECVWAELRLSGPDVHFCSGRQGPPLEQALDAYRSLCNNNVS